MRTFAEKNCAVCGITYQPTGSCSKYCIDCAKQVQKEKVRKAAYDYYVKTGRIKQPGIGSGGTTGSGEDNHMWKDGFGRLKNHGIHRIKDERKYCEACNKDLLKATRYKWCVHHIDHDITHNTDDNLMLLCKSCHQSYHKIFKSFEGATTIQKWSRDRAISKRPAPSQKG